MKSYPFIIEKYDHEIVTLGQARQWLRVDIDGYEREDDVIQELIQSSVSSVESEVNFQLGISTYEWNTDCRPCEFRDTFYVTGIESIAYKGGGAPDQDGYTLVDQINYELLKVSKRRTVIIWSDSFSTNSNRFRIRFKAGFPEGEVPKDIIKAIRARISAEFDSREDGVSEKRTLSDKLLAPYVIAYAG